MAMNPANYPAERTPKASFCFRRSLLDSQSANSCNADQHARGYRCAFPALDDYAAVTPSMALVYPPQADFLVYPP
jgi:hypothetical protein